MTNILFGYVLRYFEHENSERFLRTTRNGNLNNESPNEIDDDMLHIEFFYPRSFSARSFLSREVNVLMHYEN